MAARFGGAVFPVGDTIGDLLRDLVATPVVYKKIVGMQMLVEGIAMGAFTTLHKVARDPLLRRLCQLVMTDEAFHHRFGKIWAHATVPGLGAEEHDAVEDWALECFNLLLFNLVNARAEAAHLPALRARVGVGARRGARGLHGSRPPRASEGARPTSSASLVKTLLKAGIITERTRASYATWVDVDALAAEGDRMIGDDLAEEGIAVPEGDQRPQAEDRPPPRLADGQTADPRRRARPGGRARRAGAMQGVSARLSEARRLLLHPAPCAVCRRSWLRSWRWRCRAGPHSP